MHMMRWWCPSLAFLSNISSSFAIQIFRITINLKHNFVISCSRAVVVCMQICWKNIKRYFSAKSMFFYSVGIFFHLTSKKSPLNVLQLSKTFFIFQVAFTLHDRYSEAGFCEIAQSHAVHTLNISHPIVGDGIWPRLSTKLSTGTVPIRFRLTCIRVYLNWIGNVKRCQMLYNIFHYKFLSYCSF